MQLRHRTVVLSVMIACAARVSFAQAPAPTPSGGTTAQPAPPATPNQEPVRDPVGDLNADTVRAGTFPGSFRIPGPGGVSLGVGGYIKSLFIVDSAAEGREAIFLPAQLGGLGRDDEDGNTTLSAELSRLNFDARADVGDSRVRGYIEFDFSGDLFKWRHGYLTWTAPWGDVLAGKTWSTLMDLQILPDGLGEPTVSGAIYARQAMFRFSRPIADRLRWTVAVEDPASNDVASLEPVLTRTSWPDLISTLKIGGAGAHVQVGGLVRRIEIDPNNADGAAATGAAVSVTGQFNPTARDKVYGSFVYGEGVGRYLSGLLPTAGAFVSTTEVQPRRNTGVLIGGRHVWNAICRSSAAFSFADTQNDPGQDIDALRSTVFVLANVLCKANRFLTIGGEYDYGTRTNRDDSKRTNHRVMFGMQLF